MRRGHCTGEKRERHDSQDWYAAIEAENIALVEEREQKMGSKRNNSGQSLYLYLLKQVDTRDYHLSSTAKEKEATEQPILECNRCHREMAGSTPYDGACECGGLIQVRRHEEE